MDTSTVVAFTAPLASSPARDGFDARAAAEPVALTSPADRELARLRARVRELSAELVQAQEAACRHVARELHDGVGAELTATRFALAGVETWLPADAPPQCAAALAVANRSLDAVCEASRQAVAELHAPSLESGIVGALAHWTGDFAARTQLRTSFVCAADVRLTRLPADAALAVFRVAQEALNNIAKHARAESADVRIETSRRHLTLIISDDGVGVTRNAGSRLSHFRHFGLSGMQARCAAFDGTLRVSARRAGSERSENNENGKASRGTLVRARFAWDAMLAHAPRAARHALQS
ncbi:histidine kinase [Paraburkholderia sp. BL18I3N2]|uniref:sensor histidine kinase n=1 Tax=Paraburkholderia sp. BL18I3N2 TaxID=1938799 RepID=UPI000D057D3E|nr:ATP-binding protein [Paraburkholderia sp. BL18I3N2]PRX34267.1 histidine kinase [Paraburkholderia sp. BL18I3N2]